jgi:signal transduction histidine kinase
MKKALIAVLVVASFLFVGFVQAADHGSAKEAINLVNKAVAYYKTNGQQKAFAAINDKKGPFILKDLYVFAIDWNGVIVAHGANEKLINKPTMNLKDSEGKLFMREMVQVAQTKGTGWVDYKWTNPVSKKIEPKSSYVQRIAGKDLLIGCGIYKGN